MSFEAPMNNPEQKEALDDNDLKFTLDGIPPEFLEEHHATSYLLTTDWLKIGPNEKKLARKEYPDGEVDMLLIEKFTDENGNRPEPPKKEKLSPEQYRQLLEQSILRVEKVRHEFDYPQAGAFSMKYDEFVGSQLRILEVNAKSEAERASFDANNFPYHLKNVTGDLRYYGYHVAEEL